MDQVGIYCRRCRLSDCRLAAYAEPDAVPIDYANLPKLAVNTDFKAMGFEGHMAYGVRELRNGNPWTENNDLTTMPVFANPNEHDSARAPIKGLSPEEMLAEAERIAYLLAWK
jgi:hypothetical protein